MPLSKNLLKVFQNLMRQMMKLSKAITKGLMNWLLRTFLVLLRRQSRLAQEGFVLPTVIMVTLVVVLLTTALVLRSFDRSKTASSSRLEIAIQNTSTPAIDRARAKLDALLSDPQLPRGTPSDAKILQVMSDAKYTLADEVRLKIVNDFGDGTNGTPGNHTFSKTGDGKIETNLTDVAQDETLSTVWKYPVDTDGNGVFDSFTLYGIYWRSPSRNNNTGGFTQFDRARVPIEGRSLPQEITGLGKACDTAGLTSATSVAGSDWSQIKGNLAKAFHVYAATVPISVAPATVGLDTTKYEQLAKGSKSFSGLEYQQDRYRQGINKNAVFFQNDLILNPGADFRLNGKVLANGNFLVGGYGGAQIDFYQVSSKWSCFYDPDYAKITVGGNVGTGNISNASDDQTPAKVDLFNGYGNAPTLFPTIDKGTKSTNSSGGQDIAFNDAAYEKRIALMRDVALGTIGGSYCNNSCLTTDSPPILNNNLSYLSSDLQTSINTALKENESQKTGIDPYTVLGEQIELYLRNRTRRVPYKEVPEGTNADSAYPNGNGVFSGVVEPPAEWREPLESDGKTLKNISINLNTQNLPQTDPGKLTGPELLLGDRVIVGNNLPALWKKGDTYVGQNGETQDYADKANWTGSSALRYRITQVQALSDLGVSDRNGYWETAAALDPANASNNNSGGGGLRVITGAGIYVDDNGIAAANDTTAPSYPRKQTGGGAFDPLRPNSFLPVPNADPNAIASPAAADWPTRIWDTKFVDPSLSENLLDTTIIHPSQLRFNGQEAIVVWPDTMPMTGGKGVDISGDGPPDDTQKGDLQMRATAVYHYVDAAKANQQTEQEPIACVSSYYDPTNADTAKNFTGLPWNLNTEDPTKGKSNNGIVYKFPSPRDIPGNEPTLVRQARLVFPNGRVVNPPLRRAMQKFENNGKSVKSGNGKSDFNLADYSAVDTAICAISILNNPKSGFGDTSVIPHGVIKEAAFLDGREVKALDKLNTTQNYDLQLEERQPLEIRVTDIDVTALAATPHLQYDSDKTGTLKPEYLLPNSGILYATRDDALNDISDEPNNSKRSELNSKDISSNSTTDFQLDSTRRPNGIRLIQPVTDTYPQGNPNAPIVLAREPATNAYKTEEKGLILVSNLPVYVKGNLNPHLPAGTTNFTAAGIGATTQELEEFQTKLDSSWGNFYERGDQAGKLLEPAFACRPVTGTSASCGGTQGDQWRPATIISDAITLQSVNFNDGYRSNGDFDLRNNAGNSLSGSSASGSISLTGGFANNGFFDNSFVTSSPWWDTTNIPQTTILSQNSYLLNGVTPIQRRADNVVAFRTETCKKIPVSACTVTGTDWVLDTTPKLDTSSYDTATLDNQRYARRVYFQHSPNGQYFYDQYGYPKPTPTNIDGTDFILSPPNTLPLHKNALWFRTRKDNNKPIDVEEWNASQLQFQNDTYDGSQNLFIYLPPEALDLGVELGELRGYTLADSTGHYVGLSFPIVDTTVLPTTISPSPLISSTKVADLFKTLRGLTSDPANNTLTGAEPIIDINNSSISPNAKPLIGGGKLGIYTYPTASIPTGGLTLQGDAASIFVIIVSGPLTIPANYQVNLKGGVVEENVYWVVDGTLSLLSGSTLSGNVLAKGDIQNNSTIKGRAFSSTGSVTLSSGGKITPPTGNQPRLVPVLQVYSPDGNPAPTFNQTAQGDAGHYHQLWLQQPKNTSYNAAFVSGNSPDRPKEEGAGLHNFVRFQENWCGKSDSCSKSAANTATIKGSFIQFKRSAYATAPFASILNTSTTQTTQGLPTDGTLSIFGYQNSGYWATNNPEPYYVAPARQWGFDVGLLSQLPDLFSQRFVTPISKLRNYYREVGRDDPWIQTLLCAAQPSNAVLNQPGNKVETPLNPARTGQSGTSYDAYAVPGTKDTDCKPVTGVGLPYPANN